ENIEGASKAVNILNEAAKGRANFFILDNFKDESDSVQKEISSCVPALSILDVEDKYYSLCNHLLKNVYIVTADQEHTPFLQKEKTAADKDRLQQEVHKTIQDFSSLKSKSEHLLSSIENNVRIMAGLEAQVHSIDNALQQSNLSLHEHLLALKSDYDSISLQLI